MRHLSSPAPSRRLLTRLALPALLATAACGGEGPTTLGPNPSPTGTETTALLEGSFVPIYRDRREIEAATRALGTGPLASTPDQHFYIALAKKELGQRWFLSAYLSQFHPGATASGAAATLGTRVVSFKVQNGKLFMFDVADDKIQSDVFRPEVLLEAYPVVQDFEPFERNRNASDYVLFDPAAGLNRFSFLTETVIPVKVELSFSQRFQKIGDGATFDQVFTGLVTISETVAPGVALDFPVRVGGTVSLGLRRYTEGAGYVPSELPDVEHYFRSPPKLVPNTGELHEVAAKWNLRPGGKPIVWVISALAEKLRRDPELQDFDFAGALEKGIESWNEAFGWKALDARLARPDEAAGDDDVNFFFFDTDRSTGGAFADWRSNPNTGEIRGASVYFGLTFLDSVPPDDESPEALRVDADGGELPAARAARRPLASQLRWGDMEQERLCDLPIPSLKQILEAEPPPGTAPLTRREKVERYFAHIAAHEVGHTLGLRHNFKGSLRPPTSSVMDYNLLDEAIAVGGKVGSYDAAAVRWLYGLAPGLPADPFCTDPDTQLDAECRRFDRGAVPFRDFVLPRYHADVLPFLRAESDFFFFSPLDAMVQFVRQGPTAAARVAAWEALVQPVAVPLSPPEGAPPSFAARVDIVSRNLLRRLFLELNDDFGSPPRPAPALRREVLPLAIAHVRGVLVNEDGLRSFPTRRLAADVLKRQQNITAYGALVDAEVLLRASLPDLGGAAALETRELLTRVQRYIAAYFD